MALARALLGALLLQGGLGNAVNCPPGSLISPDGSCAKCAAGSFSSRYNFQGHPGNGSCTLCFDAHPGSHCEAGSTSASGTACPPGYSCAGLGQPPVKVAAGYYAASGSRAATPCPPGTFSEAEGAASKAACKPCQPGSYQWASGSVACKAASPGFFVAGSAATAQEPCPPGHFQGEPGKTSCAPCRVGTYNSHSGQAVCSVAAAAEPEDAANSTHFFAGYYVAVEGATAPTKCPFGTQALQLGQGSCDPCPVGHFADSYLAAEVDAHGAATNATHRVYKGCEACPIGHFGGISTEAACRPCPKGTWGGHVGAVNLESCVHCSAGKYGSREGATSGEACRPCTLATVLPGFFCPLASDSSEGVPCPDKHYCAGGDAVPAAIGAGYHVAPPHRLAPCAEGSWLPASEAYNASWRDAATGLYPCRLAAPGQYVAGTGQSQPSTCEAGTFSGAPGAPACTPCPEETWSLRGEAQCYACQAEQVTGSCHAEKEEALEGENAEYRKAMNTMRQHARVAMGAAELRRAKLQQQQQQ